MPLFPSESTVFSIKKDAKIHKEDALRITKQKLLSLSVDRPEHRPTRSKYDAHDTAMGKTNKTMTMEDNIHQDTVENIF
jgi:hypothetical protein